MSDTATRSLAWLRGGNRPIEVALAVGLGFTAGFTTGWNLIVLAIAVTAIAFRLHLRTFLAAWGIAAAFGWLLLPLSVALGRTLLEHTAFGTLPVALGNRYWAVLLDLDRYAVAGGLVLGMACGSVLAIVAWKLTRATHRRLSDTSLDDFSLNRVASRLFFDTLGSWLFIESSAPVSSVAEASWRCRLRSNWMVAVPLSLVLAIVILGVAVPRAIERRVLEELTRINGAPVTASRVEVSLQDREVRLQDVRFADPVDPNVERLRVGHAKARLRVPALALRGVWHLENVVLDDVRVDDELVAVDRAETTSTESPDGNSNSQRWRNSAGTVDLPLARYAPQIADLVQHMSRVETTAAICRRISDIEMPPTNANETWWGRREALGALRSRLGSEQPRVVVEQLWVKQLPATWQLGPAASLRIDRLASRWSADDEPAKLSIDAPAMAMRLQAVLRLNGKGQMHDVRCQFSDLKLAELIGPVANEDRLTAYGGRVSLDIEGHVLGDTIDLHAEAVADHPRLRVLGPEPWCGVSPDVWNRGFAEFDSFAARFRVLGTWEHPVLRVDQHQIQQQLKQQLAARGIHDFGSEAVSEPSGDTGSGSPRMAEGTGTTPVETPSTEDSASAIGSLADTNASDEQGLATNEGLGNPSLPADTLPTDTTADTDVPALDAHATPPYSDHATNPLLASRPTSPGTASTETVPPLPLEVSESPTTQQPQETAGIEKPEAAVDIYGSTTDHANPLRPLMPESRQPAPSLPIEAELSDTDIPDNELANTYGLDNLDTNDDNGVEEQITLPESFAEDAPGLINFESGYDQTWVPRIDSSTAVENLVENAVEDIVKPSVTRELSRRRGRIARWSRNVTTGVRNLWSGGGASDEVVVAAPPLPQVTDDADIPATVPLDDEPMMQARRPIKASETRPWYRRLW